MTRAPSLQPFASAIVGIAAFSVMDAAMKGASIEAGVYTALLARATMAAIVLLPLWLLAGGRWPTPAVLRIHLLRSAVSACLAALFFWALVRMPMAEAMALSFISPLIALYLASVLLGERVQPAAIGASFIGLTGVMVIASAHFSDLDSAIASAPAILAVLGSAGFYAWNLILQRQQALVARPLEVAAFQNLFIMLFLLPAAPWLATSPSASALSHAAVGAALSTIALILLSWGYARAEAQALAPLEYTAFIWAALAGWLWFDESLTLTTLAGTALIMLGCWIAVRRPAKTAQAPSDAPSRPPAAP